MVSIFYHCGISENWFLYFRGLMKLTNFNRSNVPVWCFVKQLFQINWTLVILWRKVCKPEFLKIWLWESGMKHYHNSMNYFDSYFFLLFSSLDYGFHRFILYLVILGVQSGSFYQNIELELPYVLVFPAKRPVIH